MPCLGYVNAGLQGSVLVAARTAVEWVSGPKGTVAQMDLLLLLQLASPPKALVAQLQVEI